MQVNKGGTLISLKQSEKLFHATPLAVVALYGRPEFVKFLLENGANPFIKNGQGKNCLDLADDETKQFIITTLKRTNSKLLLKFDEEFTPRNKYSLVVLYTEKNAYSALSTGYGVLAREHGKLANRIDFKLENHLLCDGKSTQQFFSTIRSITREGLPVLVLLSGNPFENRQFCSALEIIGNERKCKIILVHDLKSGPFPQLPSELKRIPFLQSAWNHLAIPLVDTYSKECWKKIGMKLKKHEDNSVESTRSDIFLSHVQKSGQGIALSLFLSLRQKHEVFLDVKAKFELHELKEIVKKSKLFVFILSEGILQSNYCFEEFVAARESGRQIVLVKEFSFELPEPDHTIRARWGNENIDILYDRRRVIEYVANYVDECAHQISLQLGSLKSLNQNQNVM